MFQVEHYLVHRQTSLKGHAARLIKAKVRQLVKYQVPAVGADRQRIVSI